MLKACSSAILPRFTARTAAQSNTHSMWRGKWAWSQRRCLSEWAGGGLAAICAKDASTLHSRRTKYYRLRFSTYIFAFYLLDRAQGRVYMEPSESVGFSGQSISV